MLAAANKRLLLLGSKAGSVVHTEGDGFQLGIFEYSSFFINAEETFS